MLVWHVVSSMKVEVFRGFRVAYNLGFGRVRLNVRITRFFDGSTYGATRDRLARPIAARMLPIKPCASSSFRRLCARSIPAIEPATTTSHRALLMQARRTAPYRRRLCRHDSAYPLACHIGCLCKETIRFNVRPTTILSGHEPPFELRSERVSECRLRRRPEVPARGMVPVAQGDS